MIKRALFTCLLAALAFWAGPASAESIGIVLTGDTPYYREINQAFQEQLRKEGLAGKVEVLVQTPAPDPVAWANAARKMAVMNPTVLVVYGAPAALAVMKEVSGTPIVFAGVPDPEALGVKGKNITGISSRVQVAGIIKNFREIKNFQKLGVIYNAHEKDSAAQAGEIAKLAGQFGFTAVKFNVKSRADAEGIKGVDALFVTTSCVASHCITGISKAAKSLGAPIAAAVSGGSPEGVVLTVSASPQEQGETAAGMVSRILKGAAPSGIRVESPRKIDVIVNLREANEMGLKVPLDILSAATKVVK